MTRAAPTPAGTPANGPLVLTLWAPDFLTPGGDGASGALLAKYLREFEAAQGGKVSVRVVPKAAYGKGGLLDLLRAAQPVAPGILPDAVALDFSELPAAASAGLLQPLDGSIDPLLLASFYPFGQDAARFNGRTVAMPLVADIDHLVYNSGRVQKPPSTWADLFSSEAVPYLFPLVDARPGASSSDGLPAAFVSQYLSAGGSLDARTRELVPQQDPLLRVLTFYSQARAAGVLPATVARGANLDEGWSWLNDDTIAVADVSARRYLAARDTLKNSAYAPAPGWNGPATPVASGWALGVVATDPARKKAAADLLAWLLAPDRLGAWSQAAGYLPASPRAWASWGSDAYYDFLQSQLAAAALIPKDSQAGAQLQKAIESVLRDGVAPQDAARSIATPVAKGG